jgi:spoIIIJ-associated protein
MAGIFGRLFGKKEGATTGDPKSHLEETFAGLLETAGLALDFEARIDETREGAIYFEVFGDDEELLTQKDGQLIDAFQLFLTRVAQHRFSEQRILVNVDNEGYREEVQRELVELAEKLKGVALERGKPVYFRALAPRDRKVVHQYLAETGEVKSHSVGDGLFKKIKIYPVKEDGATDTAPEL